MGPLIKELKSDNTQLQQRLLKEADRHRAYVEKSKAILAKNKKEMEALWTEYKALLNNESLAHKEAEKLEAKLTEMEIKELLSDTTV